jgi:hypothetical protein
VDERGARIWIFQVTLGVIWTFSWQFTGFLADDIVCNHIFSDVLCPKEEHVTEKDILPKKLGKHATPVTPVPAPKEPREVHLRRKRQHHEAFGISD